MRSKNSVLLTLSLLLAGPAFASYEAHEWGTFTSVINSDGTSQSGLFHEDEALPDFVHGFGELRADFPIAPPPPPNDVDLPPCRPRSKVCFDLQELRLNQITQKMETPVIYFYLQQSSPQNVQVNVQFPQGIITETYPGPVATYPTMKDPHVVANGNTTFAVQISQEKSDAVPSVEPGNIYGHARYVNSNIVKSGMETEKFIFYRGLGHFQPQISITSKDGSLKISQLEKSRPQMAVLIDVDANGDGQMLVLDSVKTQNEFTVPARRIEQLRNHEVVLSKFIIKGEQARGKLIDELMASGLFKDEAVAMINTWENGYLKVPGLRLLYILPRTEVDQVLPLTMNPIPTKLVRTFVGRLEIVLDTDEQKILNDIENQKQNFSSLQLGRFAEPILNAVRSLVLKNQPGHLDVLAQIDQLILSLGANTDSNGTLN